jgi:hypothetical protein
MALPLVASKNFVTLAEQYRELPIEFPPLKAITLAQWAEESGWGRTSLADRHLNFAGMKWGAVDADFGSPVMYGQTRYTQFSDLTSFIHAYWHRLDAVSVFDGWRIQADDPVAFVNFITPGWLSGRMPVFPLTSDERRYTKDIWNICRNRTEEFFRATE